jgi:large subunit ribosomal protein L25
MAEDFQLIAESRTDTGKGASRRLRRTGQVPGIIYGTGNAPHMIAVKHTELLKHLEHEAFYSHILTVHVDGKPEKVVLKDLQRHPAKPFVQHLDLLRISATEKLKMHVPLHFENEDTAPGIKLGGIPLHHVTDVEVICLPGDLPEFIAVNVGALDVGDAIHLSQITLPPGVELPALALGPDHDLAIFAIVANRKGKDDDAEDAAVEDVQE